MGKALIIGFGNIDRADDGVAFHIVNALRRHLGREPLSDEVTGLDELGGQIDAVFLAQLTPELIEIMSNYEDICFVDAHVYETAGNIFCTSVRPEEAALTFTHHLSPAMLLALLQSLYQHSVTAFLVSVRGYDFDFHRNLSPPAQDHVEPAVNCIIERLGLR